MTTIPLSTAVTTEEIERSEAASRATQKKWAWFAVMTVAFIAFGYFFATWYFSVPAFFTMLLAGQLVNNAHVEHIALEAQGFLERRS